MGNILPFWGRRVRSWNFRLISQIATFQLKGFFLFRGIMTSKSSKLNFHPITIVFVWGGTFPFIFTKADVPKKKDKLQITILQVVVQTGRFVKKTKNTEKTMWDGLIWVFPPKWMVYNGKPYYIKWMIWGENPLFLETPIYEMLSNHE